MERSATRPSLYQRIAQTEVRAAYVVDRSVLERPREPSFSERYRGTAFETPVRVTPGYEPALSRGRYLVLVGAVGLVGIVGFALAISPA